MFCPPWDKRTLCMYLKELLSILFSLPGCVCPSSTARVPVCPGCSPRLELFSSCPSLGAALTTAASPWAAIGTCPTHLCSIQSIMETTKHRQKKGNFLPQSPAGAKTQPLKKVMENSYYIENQCLNISSEGMIGLSISQGRQSREGNLTLSSDTAKLPS